MIFYRKTIKKEEGVGKEGAFENSLEARLSGPV
jgi:hypothetical protein